MEEVWKSMAFSPYGSKKTPSLTEFKESIRKKSKQAIEDNNNSLKGFGKMTGNI